MTNAQLEYQKKFKELGINVHIDKLFDHDDTVCISLTRKGRINEGFDFLFRSYYKTNKIEAVLHELYNIMSKINFDLFKKEMING
jgi:hypothetical protein